MAIEWSIADPLISCVIAAVDLQDTDPYQIRQAEARSWPRRWKQTVRAGAILDAPLSGSAQSCRQKCGNASRVKSE
jgi:hypothetical protein